MHHVKHKQNAHLIRHRHKNRAKEQVSAEWVGLLSVDTVLSQQIVGHLSQNRERNHEIIAIRLDKIVPCDGRGIDMVLPERPQKVLKERRQVMVFYLIVILKIAHTLPRIGNSMENHVSAAQWTNPDPKSAVRIPASPATTTVPTLSMRK